MSNLKEDFKNHKNDMVNMQLATDFVKAVSKAMERPRKGVNGDEFRLVSVMCEQNERDALESRLKQTQGVGATFIDMAETFLVHGLWLMPTSA